MPLSTDVAIIGAGIIGLAHAYAAARAGKSVVVFEKKPQASGASVRNFGMVWPIGQPHGEMLQLALRSRELWLEILTEAKLPCRNDGSLHLTYARDEADVAEEFAAAAPGLGYRCQWLSPAATLAKSDAILTESSLGTLRGALFSDTELTVDPRQILAALPGFLAARYGVQFRFSRQVNAVASHPAHLAVETPGETWQAQTAFICSGEDFETLYPAHFAESGLTRCKLQMLRTAPQPDGWQLGPSLAAGLTLRFYEAFKLCKTLPALARRIAAETPEYDRWFIHALVSQTADGALTLGDSHQYGLHVDPFNREDVDDLILQYTFGFLKAPDLRIAERWQGVYAKHPARPLVTMTPEPNVHIVASPGGSGMTLSFGVGERSIREAGLSK
jgi:FAD dependent oxidoreductase TIGR03364